MFVDFVVSEFQKSICSYSTCSTFALTKNFIHLTLLSGQSAPNMSKSKAKRKQQAENSGGLAKKAKTEAITTSPPDVEPKTLQSVGLHQDDLEIAIDTLNTLAENPIVIKSKACKDLRTAVYAFRQACVTGFNASGLPPLHYRSQMLTS